MTGRTHDLIAFTTLSVIVFSQPLHPITLGTAIIAFNANLIGGLMPDIDQPTAKLWHEIPAGSVLGKVFSPLLGGHRFISHSLFGIFLFGFLANWFLTAASKTILVDIHIVWWAFMIGYISHVVADTFTHEGVPWLFPIAYKFGIPPVKALRPHTGGIIETAFIFPLLIVANAYIYYTHYRTILSFLHHYIK